MKKLLFFLFVGLTIASAQVPLKGSLRADQSSSENLESEIDGLLAVQGSDIMAGIKGYGLNYAKAIEQKVMDEVIAAVADAVVLAPAAQKIMSIYQKKKNRKLAEKIDEVKDVAKKALSTQLKIQYQDYKVEYERFLAHAKIPTSIKNSKASQVAKATTDELWSGHVGIMDEYYNTPAKNALLENTYKDMGYYIFGTSAALAKTDDLKAKMAIANREYNPTSRGNSEVAGYSPYERMMMMQEIRKEALSRRAAQYGLQGTTRTVIMQKQRAGQMQRYSRTIKLATETH